MSCLTSFFMIVLPLLSVCSHCQLPKAFFLYPIRSDWSSIARVADKLAEFTFSKKTRMFKRSQGLELLTALIRGNKNSLKDFESITAHIVTDLDAYIKGEKGGRKPRFLCETLNLINVLRVSKADENNAKWTELVEKLKELKGFMPSNRHFRDVKKAYNKTCSPLGIGPITAADKRYVPRSP